MSSVEIRSQFTEDRQRVPQLISTVLACGATVHAFFYEPWAPIVIRARGETDALLSLREALANLEDPPVVVPWEPFDDEQLFGPETYKKAVGPFFEASTRVAYQTTMTTATDVRLTQGHLLFKLVHCFLNAQGFDTPHEARFAKDFLKNRRRQARRDYGRMWWLRRRWRRK